MPPKKKEPNAPNKKTVEKKKEKVIEDKTFGLKNKKGNKQQKFIKTVTQQVKFGHNAKKPAEDPAAKKKDEKKKELENLNMLFKPVQTVAKGVDPKSVLCAFFKQGQCKKGDKCKFSHDLNISRKGEKRSVYADAGDEEEDTMDKWDVDKLEDVVNKKHGETNKAKPKTAIICKFFLEAVEGSKYGWFWECPNGEKCIYKHTLPPGFVLKKDQKKEDKEDQISIEELIEKERAALGHNTTRVTLETFLKWKERKKREKMETVKCETDRKKAEFKAGKTLGISGREMFEFNPDLIVQDDEEADDTTVQYEAEGEEEEEAVEVHEINLEALAAQAREIDGTGTVSTSQIREGSTSQLPNINIDDEGGKLDEAAALPPPDPHIETDAAIAAAMAATINGDFAAAADVPIDEDLFDGEDLDMLEDDLETLDLDDQ